MIKLSKKQIKINLIALAFIAPLLVYFLVFQLAPMIMAFCISFTEWNMRSPMEFVGFDNYYDLLFNSTLHPQFYQSLIVTVSYILLTVPFSIALTLIVSAMLNSKIKGERFFKTAFYIPSVTVGVAISAMWMFMLNPTYGFINQMLGTNISFLGSADSALPTLAVMAVWSGLGYNVLIMLSAMKNIDKSLYESASMDGASPVKQFFYITLPGVMPTIFFFIITGMIGAFQAFDQMYLMTGGGPEFSTYSYMLGVYKQAFEYDSLGVASAMSYILFVIILFITFIQFKLLPSDGGDKKDKKRGGKRERKRKEKPQYS